MCVGKDAVTGKTLEDSYEQKQTLYFPIGDMVLNVVDHGTMLACKSMRVGEVCEVRVLSRFTFRQKDMHYRLELVNIEDYEKTPVELIESDSRAAVEYISLYKDRGNVFFKKVNKEHDILLPGLKKAELCYKHAIQLSEAIVTNPESQQKHKQVQDVYVKSLSNLALVYERQEKLKEAIELCMKILMVDEFNLKNLVRIIRISTKQGNFKESEAALDKALGKYPGNKLVEKEKENLAKAKRTYKTKTKEMYSGFLKMSATSNAGAAPHQTKDLRQRKPDHQRMVTDLPKTLNREQPPRSDMMSKGVILLLPTIAAVFYVILVLFWQN